MTGLFRDQLHFVFGGAERNHHSDKTSADRHVSSHLSHSVIHECNHAGVSRIREQETKRAALIEGTSDTNEQRCTNGSTNSNELDLTISKMALEIIGVISYRTMLDVIAVVGFANELARVLLLGGSHGCKGSCRAGSVAWDGCRLRTCRSGSGQCRVRCQGQCRFGCGARDWCSSRTV